MNFCFRGSPDFVFIFYFVPLFKINNRICYKRFDTKRCKTIAVEWDRAIETPTNLFAEKIKTLLRSSVLETSDLKV